MSSVQTIGAHLLQVDKDVVCVKVVGTFALPEAREVHRVFASVLSEQGSVFALVGFSEGSTIGPATRHFIAEWHKTHRVAGVVVFGANIAIRAVARLALTAIALFRKDPVPHIFVATEQDGRDWIEQNRPRL